MESFPMEATRISLLLAEVALFWAVGGVEDDGEDEGVLGGFYLTSHRVRFRLESSEF